MIDMVSTLKDLSQERPVFHNEFDFQHELACQIKSELSEDLPDIKVRIELPYARSSKTMDISIQGEEAEIVIEMKYATCKLDTQIKHESFSLKDRKGQPAERYGFWKDVERLQILAEGRNNIVGYVIFLTNDRSYWEVAKGGADNDFKIHEGRTVSQGEMLHWQGKNLKPDINIGYAYRLGWQDYSNFDNVKFKYLLLRIPLCE